MTDEELRALLAPLLTRRLSPARRERIAVELERIARQQRMLAAAQTRATTERGQGREPGQLVRLTRVARVEGRGLSQDRDVEEGLRRRRPGLPRLRLYIGKALWREIGSPGWISLPLLADRMMVEIRAELAPSQGHYRLVLGEGMPRAWVDGARGRFRDFADGYYVPEVRGSSLFMKGAST